MTYRPTYKPGSGYRFLLAGGGRETAIYLGKNKQGMYRFLLAGGQVWTGYVPPIIEGID